MPELPEVETTRQGVQSLLLGARVAHLDCRQCRLRWPVPVQEINAALPGSLLQSVQRRAKYLLLGFSQATLLWHLGMSGSLRVLERPSAPQPHDHLDLVFHDGRILRYRDPRRFGALLLCPGVPQSHPLLRDLGPEPLSEAFTATRLLADCQGRRSAIKTRIMDSHVVVGVGNIYAAEALFLAGIRPQRPAGSLVAAEAEALVAAIRTVLTQAIQAGGTTLRDFQGTAGQPGYFAQALQVYGRSGAPC
ncbi:MAG: bifunctional DNA-formamidopyrimidine glycosylase/DNA-(apurinic or apyrimidinic site) lyase, partial [Magnetococcus sp. WYHC-3]